MTLWSQAPTRFRKLPDNASPQETIAYLQEVASIAINMAKDLQHIINGNVDFKNVRAKSIVAGSLDVDELSAISADLGTITAGIIRGIQIFGSYIATADGTYPRSEMDVAAAYFAALASATNFVKMLPSGFGAPALRFEDGVTGATISTFNGVDFYFYISSDRDIRIESLMSIHLAADTVFVPSWNDLVSESSSTSIQSELNAKANAFIGYTGSVAAGTSTMHFTNGILTSVT